MTKKRFIVALAAIMILVLSVAVFVACDTDDDTPEVKTYTVKFVDGTTEVKSVTVEEGKTIAEADIPSDPTKDGESFEGWFNGDVEFDETAPITADVTYTAKWKKVAYAVKFVSGNEVVKTVYITIAEDAKLSADDIAAAQTAEGKAFAGWFTADGVEAKANLAVSADMTFEALFVTESDFEGYWINTTANAEALARIKDGKVSFGKDVKNSSYTYNADGTLTYGKNGDGSATYTFSRTRNGVRVLNRYYDAMEEDFVEYNYVLTKAVATEESKSIAGTYQNSKNNIIVILENGVVERYNTSDNTVYGYAVGTTDVTIKYTNGATAISTVTAVYDQTSLIINGQIYVKNASSFAGYYNSATAQNLYVYEREGKETVYTYGSDKTGTAYATVEGTVAIGNKVKISCGDVVVIAKITSATTFDLPTTEAGTYTGSKGEIVLDGFGKATVDGVEKDYIVAGNLIDITDVATISIDKENGTYTEAAEIGMAGTYLLFANNVHDKSQGLELNGYGIAKHVTSSTTYYGSYTIENGKLVLKNTGKNYTYTLFDSNKGMVYTSYNKETTVWYNKANVATSVDFESFVGYFVNGTKAIEITKYSDTAYILSGFDDTNYRIKSQNESWDCNWDGTMLIHELDDACAEFKNKKANWFFSIDADGNLVVSHFCHKDDGDGYVELSLQTVVYTKTTKPVTFEDYLVGTWYTSQDTVVITKDTITVNDVLATDLAYDTSTDTYTFKVSDVEYKIVGNWYEYSFGKADGSALETLSTTKPTPATIEDFIGSYTGEHTGSGTTVTIKVESAESVTLNISGTAIEVTSITLGTDRLTLVTASATYVITRTVETVGYSYVFNDEEGTLGSMGYGINLTRKTDVQPGEKIPAQFIGEWTASVTAWGSTTEYLYTITEDGATLVIDGDTANAESLTFVSATETVLTLNSAANGDYAFTLKDANTLHFYENYYNEYDLTKKASSGGEETNAFVGTWEGKIGIATFTIVINADGTFTANGTDYHYTVDSETTASSVEADGSDKYFIFTLKDGKLRVQWYSDDDYETRYGDLTKQA